MPAYSLGTMSAWAVTSNTDQIISGAKTFQAAATSSTPLTAMGISGQTGDLQRWNDAANGVRASVTNEGRFFISPSGNGMSSVLIRNAANQTVPSLEIQNSAGTMLARFKPSGGLIVGANEGSALGSVDNLGSILAIHTASAGNKGLTFRAAASQTAPLTEWQDSAGTQFHRVMSNGEAVFRYLKGGNPANAFPNQGQFEVQTESTGIKGIVVRGVASQTGSLIEFQMSDGVVRTRVAGDTGALGVNMNPTGVAWLAVTGVATSDTVSAFRGLASHTGNLTVWQNSAGSVLARVEASGNFFAPIFFNGNNSWNMMRVVSGDFNAQRPSGIYDMNNCTNAPTADAWHHLIQMTHGNGNNFMYQIAFTLSNQSNTMYTRQCTNGTWHAWRAI